MTTQDTTAPAAAAGTITLSGEFTVNRMGYGAMRITGPGIWGEPRDRDEAKRVLRRALDLGVDFIDTADAYGPDTSENIIAEALYPYPSGLVIATKGGQTRPGPDDWVPNGRPDYLRKAIDGSLKRLRLDHIDLYQLHRPDRTVPYAESVGTLVDLKNEGKIRLIGISNVTMDQLAIAQSLTPVASVQNRYNLEDRGSEDVLQSCQAQGIAFIPWGPLAAGPLTTSRGALGQVAKEHGVTPAQVALAWLLQRSPAMLVIPGTSRVSHLEENAAAAALQLTPDDVAQLDDIAG
ncbi:MAG TPA: aldo/keto reductase [Chloroflexota bacterium]|nr:aldo/keto reductase [Chloroflexota bacterium]